MIVILLLLMFGFFCAVFLWRMVARENKRLRIQGETLYKVRTQETGTGHAIVGLTVIRPYRR